MIHAHVVAVAAVLAIATSAEEIERPIALEDVPLKARTVILAEAGDHEIVEVEEVTFDEGIFYEAEWLADGMEVEVRVTPNGTVVSREVEEPDGENEDDDDDRDGDGENEDDRDD